MAYNTTGIATVDREVHAKLSALRRHLRGRLIGEGLAWVLVALVAAAFATLGIDYLLRLERPYRIAMASAALLAIAMMIWRELVAPMLAPMRAEDLALLVERRHKQLGDRLISALQFIRTGSATPNESPAMVAETVRQANTITATLDLADIVERRNFRRMLAIAACTVSLVAGFGIWKSRLVWPWLQRNIVFADTEYPQDTYLQVAGGPDFKVLRGTNLKIVIRTDQRSTVCPPYAIVHAYYPSLDKGSDDGWTEEQADHAGKDDEGRDYFVMTFPRVSEQFSFYVTGGDDNRVTDSQTEKHYSVRLIDPPALAGISFTGELPRYLAHERGPDGKVDDLLGTVKIPAGTTLTVSATATKDLQAVRIFLDGRPVEGTKSRKTKFDIQNRLKTQGPEPTTRPKPTTRKARGPRGAGLRAESFWDTRDSSFGLVALFPFRAASSTGSISFELAFELKDTDGYTSLCGQRKIIVRLDARPGVKTNRRIVILKDDNGQDIATPVATVPLTSDFTDDHDLATARARVAVKLKGQAVGSAAIHVPFRKPGERRIIRQRTVGHEVDLQTGDLGALAVGSEVTIEVLADDSMPVFRGGPNTGFSGPVVIKIAEPDVVREKLRESAEAAMISFVKVITLQTKVRENVRMAGRLLNEGKGLDAAVTMLAPSVVKIQKQVYAGTDTKAGCKQVAEAVGDILFAAKCNRLGNEEEHENIRRKIIYPLRELAEPSAAAAALIKRAANVQDPDQLEENITTIINTQSLILNTMAGVLIEMEKDISRQGIIYRWKLMVDESKRTRDQIKKRSDTQTGSVFDEKKDKKDDKDKDKKKDANPGT